MAPRRGRSVNRGGAAAAVQPVRLTTVSGDGNTNQIRVLGSNGQFRVYDVVPHTPGDSFLILSYRPQTVHRTFITLKYKSTVTVQRSNISESSKVNVDGESLIGHALVPNLNSGLQVSEEPDLNIFTDNRILVGPTSPLLYDTPVSANRSNSVAEPSSEGEDQSQALLPQTQPLSSKHVPKSVTPAPPTPTSISVDPGLQDSYQIVDQETQAAPAIVVHEATESSTDPTSLLNCLTTKPQSSPADLLGPVSTPAKARRGRPANRGSARARTRRLRNQLAEQDINLADIVGQTTSLQHSPEANMAPVRDPTDVSAAIKDVFQNLYDIQSQTHGFIPETQELLVDKMTDLTQTLSHLQKLTSPTESPNNPVHTLAIAPEIVDYVDDGRNPDIFTRDFVENVQRGNAVINGKQQAFHDFAQVLAKAMKEGISGVDRHVDHIMENAGIEQLSTERKTEDKK